MVVLERQRRQVGGRWAVRAVSVAAESDRGASNLDYVLERVLAQQGGHAVPLEILTDPGDATPAITWREVQQEP